MSVWITALIISSGLNVLLFAGVIEMKLQQREDNDNLSARLRQLISTKELYDEEKRRCEYWHDKCLEFVEKSDRYAHIINRVAAQAKSWKTRYLFEKKMKEEAVENFLLSESHRYKEKTEALKKNRQFMVASWLQKMGLPVNAPGTELPATVLKYAMGERVKKIEEEVKEAKQAWYRIDTIGFIDAMTDISFAAECAGALLGYDSGTAFYAVYKSNMTKDPAVFKIDGRGKTALYKEPDFSEALKKAES